jgi:hypothetical protein
MNQTILELSETPLTPEAANRAIRERIARAGIRPPTRFDVRPEDLAPPVRELPHVVALALRVMRWAGR